MRHKREVILLCLGACAIASFGYDSGFMRRLQARHIKETIMVSAGNSQLRSLFAGLPANPKWNVTLALQAAKTPPHCGANRGVGFFGRLMSRIERTVYAQSGCSSQSCSGQQAIPGNPGVCNTGNCTGTFQQVASDASAYPCGGNRQPGTTGCSGSDCPSGGVCDVVTCNSCGGGGNDCITRGQECDPDDDNCCTGTTCNEGDGICESIQ